MSQPAPSALDRIGRGVAPRPTFAADATRTSDDPRRLLELQTAQPLREPRASAGSPMLITTIDRQVESAKNSPSTPAASNPAIGPAASPTARTASTKYPACSEALKRAWRSRSSG